MVPLEIIPNGDGCWPELYDENGRPKFITGDWTAIALLPGGTSGGRASVTVRIELPNGQTVLAQTTLKLLALAVAAFNVVEGR